MLGQFNNSTTTALDYRGDTDFVNMAVSYSGDVRII